MEFLAEKLENFDVYISQPPDDPRTGAVWPDHWFYPEKYIEGLNTTTFYDDYEIIPWTGSFNKIMTYDKLNEKSAYRSGEEDYLMKGSLMTN